MLGNFPLYCYARRGQGHYILLLPGKNLKNICYCAGGRKTYFAGGRKTSSVVGVEQGQLLNFQPFSQDELTHVGLRLCPSIIPAAAIAAGASPHPAWGGGLQPLATRLLAKGAWSLSRDLFFGK